VTVAGSIATVLGQVSLPSPGASEFFGVLGSLVLIAVCILLYFNIQVSRRKLSEPHDPTRRILPDPIRTETVKDFVTTQHFERFDQESNRKFTEIGREIAKEGRRLDQRINDVLTAISKLEGAFHQSQRRQHPNDR